MNDFHRMSRFGRSGIGFGLAVGITAATVIAIPAAQAAPTPPSGSKDSVTTVVFDKPTNISGKSMVAEKVYYPPGSKPISHHHPSSAFIMAYVLSGQVRNQSDEGEPIQVLKAGDAWSEKPGAHHLISENASDTEPAEFLAVFLLDTGTKPLITFDDGSVGD